MNIRLDANIRLQAHVTVAAAVLVFFCSNNRIVGSIAVKYTFRGLCGRTNNIMLLGAYDGLKLRPVSPDT